MEGIIIQNKDEKRLENERKLREKAENFQNEIIGSPPSSPEEIAELIHELQVHQIELEMQNDELRTTQDLLEKSRDSYSDLYDFAPVGYVTLDRNGNILEANFKCTQHFGVDRNRLIGASIFPYICLEDQIRFQQFLKGIISDTEPDMLELQFKNADGVVFDAQVQGIVVNNENDGEKLIRVVLSDVTDFNQIKENVVKLQRVKSISLLAGGIAHDFNNILAVLLSAVNILKTQVSELSTGSQAIEILSNMEDTVWNARRLTRQLLVLSRGGSKGKKYINLSVFLKEVVNLILRGANCKPHFDVESGLWPIEADEDQVHQAISNIVINAKEAMPKGGIIEVAAQNIDIQKTDIPQLEPGKYVMVSIKDSGIGISKKNLKRIFHTVFTTKDTGIGIGLMVIQMIIQGHGGHIIVDSKEGVGTTFSFYLPATIKNGEIIQAQSGEAPPLVKRSAKILLMDDMKQIRDLSKLLLTRAGYSVVCVEDGQTAIQDYRDAFNTENAYDVVILDLTIPGGMGGKEAITKLREINPDVKAIVMSGYSEDPVLESFRNFGFAAAISKPFKSEELFSVIEELLQP